MIDIINTIINRATFEEIQQGLTWYKNLNDYCKTLEETYNVPLWKITAIMSILSPRTSFKNNIHDTEQLLRNGINAKLKSPLFKDKAIKAYNAESYDDIKALFNESTGRKTLSFWENLLNIGNRATIDVHMIRHLKIKGSLTAKKYTDAEKCIQQYAKIMNAKPYEVQAILWVVVRGTAF